MNAARLLYRTRQLWMAVGAAPTAEDLSLVRAVLAPSQITLFEDMNRSEQAHSLRVLRALLEQGETHPDLQVAALLHDVGKSRFPLSLWERILVVLGKMYFPRSVHRLGAVAGEAIRHSADLSQARGWRRAFAVAENHPAWGADMVARAGASSLAVALIRQHQDPGVCSEIDSPAMEERLLCLLQSVDNES